MTADWLTPADVDGYDEAAEFDAERIEAEVRRKMAARAAIPHNACGCYSCGPSNKNLRIDKLREIDADLDDYLFFAGVPELPPVAPSA